MILPRQIRESTDLRVTIAIEDPEFATLRVRLGIQPEQVDVKHIPCDVVAYCRWLDRTGSSGREK